MKIFSVIEIILHYFFCLPAKIIVAFVTALKIISKILSLIGVTVLQNLVKILDTNALAPYVGFKNGITPISSWQNFGLYFLIIGVACLLMLPTITILNIKSQKTSHLKEKLSLRLKIGQLLNNYKTVATAFLLITILLAVFKILSVPFSFVMKFLVLFCLGALFGIDNLKYSNDGRKYGMAPLRGKTKAIEALADDLGLELRELKKELGT